jgi:hypothetical protein
MAIKTEEDLDNPVKVLLGEARNIVDLQERTINLIEKMNNRITRLERLVFEKDKDLKPKIKKAIKSGGKPCHQQKVRKSR